MPHPVRHRLQPPALLALLTLAALTFSSFAVAAEPTRLPRENLLVYRDATGATGPVRTAADWPPRRAEIVRGMETVMGAYPGATSPKRVPLDVRIEEEIDRDTYVLRRITYQSEPGSRTPAFLCIPKAALTATSASSRAFPAVLCLHPTDQNAGAGVVVGLGGKPNRQYASELATRGYVTIAPAYPYLAGYAPDLKGLGYASGTMKAIWDNTRALDLLASLPFVKISAGFGAIGTPSAVTMPSTPPSTNRVSPLSRRVAASIPTSTTTAVNPRSGPPKKAGARSALCRASSTTPAVSPTSLTISTRSSAPSPLAPSS
jgi:hypothetical protein